MPSFGWLFYKETKGENGSGRLAKMIIKNRGRALAG
jgi:hypothetical protein